MVGVVLWRGGLAFVAGYLFYLGSWRLLVILDWPAQITAGAALAMTGLGLVLVSLILERIAAARQEGDLLSD
jgi:hypothetical protein